MVATIFQEAIEKWVLPYPSMLMCLLSLILGFIGVMLFWLFQRTVELSREVGVKVHYFQRGYHHGNLFKEVSEIVKTARESIYIGALSIDDLQRLGKYFEGDPAPPIGTEQMAGLLINW